MIETAPGVIVIRDPIGDLSCKACHYLGPELRRLELRGSMVTAGPLVVAVIQQRSIQQAVELVRTIVAMSRSRSIEHMTALLTRYARLATRKYEHDLGGLKQRVDQLLRRELKRDPSIDLSAKRREILNNLRSS